jgi:hypothetical protein
VIYGQCYLDVARRVDPGEKAINNGWRVPRRAPVHGRSQDIASYPSPPREASDPLTFNSPSITRSLHQLSRHTAVAPEPRDVTHDPLTCVNLISSSGLFLGLTGTLSI